jgi:nicotinamide-nucleotide amidase
MARGAASGTGADWALATTGVAGPDLQEGKPAGTVFVGLVGPGVETYRRLALDGDRQDVRAGTVVAALDMLGEVLLSANTPGS